MKQKKAMFFSLIGILMVLVIMISYKMATEKSMEETKLASTQTRVKTLNSFINDLENVYFEDMLKVAAKTALQALSNYTAQKTLGIAINEEDIKPGAFETVMLFGYLIDNAGGVDCGDSLCKEYKSKLSDAQFVRYRNYQFRKIDKDLKTPIMQNYAFFDLLKKTENTLENLGVTTDSFSISISSLTQKDYWTVHFTATIDYHFIDKYEIAAWRGRTEKKNDVNIYGFEDPITKKIIDKSWEGDVGPPTLCGTVLCQYNYPSFLNRLKPGTDSDNTKGICAQNEDCDIT